MSPDADPPRAPARWLPTLVAIGLLSLVANIVLGWFVWQTTRTQNFRLARLESLAETARPAGTGDAVPGAHPRRAGIDERVALLLSMAGDPEHSRRVLETVSPSETMGIAQALLAQPPASDRNAALGAVIEALGRVDPARAIAVLDNVQIPVLRARLAASIAEVWSARDPAAAARWLVTEGARFSRSRHRRRPAAAGAGAMVGLRPRRARRNSRRTNRRIAGPVTRSLGGASRAWGQKDPQAALAWAQALPAPDQRRDLIIQSVWQGWNRAEPRPGRDRPRPAALQRRTPVHRPRGHRRQGVGGGRPQRQRAMGG